MLLVTALCLAALGFLNAFGDPPENAVKKELKATAAKWQPVSAENNGNKAAEGELKDTR